MDIKKVHTYLSFIFLGKVKVDLNYLVWSSWDKIIILNRIWTWDCSGKKKGSVILCGSTNLLKMKKLVEVFFFFPFPLPFQQNKENRCRIQMNVYQKSWALLLLHVQHKHQCALRLLATWAHISTLTELWIMLCFFLLSCPLTRGWDAERASSVTTVKKLPLPWDSQDTLHG